MREASARGFAVVGAACLLAGWVLGSTVRPPVALTQEAVRARVLEPPVAVPSLPSITAARRRLGAVVQAPAGARNPFAFGSSGLPASRPRVVRRTEPATSLESPAGVDVVTASAAAPGNASLSWQLVGLASDGPEVAPVLRAILSDGRDVHVCGAGESLPDGVAIEDVTEQAVVLRLPSGETRTLRLASPTPGD